MLYSSRPAQTVTQARMMENPYQLIALRMGGGKTVATLTVIKELKLAKTLVVAPKRVAEMVWHREAAKWDHLADLRVAKVLGTKEQRMRGLMEDADVYVINRENFVWLVKLVAERKSRGRLSAW